MPRNLAGAFALNTGKTDPEEALVRDLEIMVYWLDEHFNVQN